MTTQMNFLINAHDRASRVFNKVARAAKKLDFVVKGMKMASVASMRTALVALGAQATPVILALGAALAKVGPAALIAVPALAALVASLAAVKLAMFGVKDAFTAAASGDMKEFAEALKKLSPAAQRFVKDGAKLIPALRSMRKAVQEAFFSKIPEGTLGRIAKNLLPALRSGLTSVSSSLGRAAANLATFLKTGEARTGLTKTFAGIVAALKPLERVPATLARAFAGLAASAAPFLTKLTSGFARMLDGLSSKISKASASGGLTAMIQTALDTLNQLGRIAGNVGRIIGGLFKGSANNSLVDSIERITKAIADAVNSERGQQVIAKVFEIMAKAGPVVTVAAALAVVLGAIGGALSALTEPAVLVAGALIAVGAGFAVLYTKSAALREIVAGVGGKLRELWDLFVAKGLPVLKDFVANALAGAIAGFNNVRNAIQRNKPELEQLWAGVKKVAEFIMAHWPAMSAVGVAAFKGIFAGITSVINLVGGAVRAFNLMKNTTIGAAMAVLRAFSLILGGIAKFAQAMSKVPGIGALWRPVVTAANRAKNAIDGISNAINNVPRHISLTVGIRGTSAAYATLNQLSARARAGAELRAAGGPVRKGQPYIVGEKRPELFIPNSSGRIVPRVPAMSGGGGGGAGGTVRVVFEDRGGESLFLSAIRQMVWVEGGGNVQLAFGKAGR